MGACFQAPHATPGQKLMEANLFVMVCIDTTDYNNTMDSGCLIASCLCTWPAVYAG